MKAVTKSRFRNQIPACNKGLAKEMLPIYNKPIIQYLVEEAVASGIDDIIIITGKHQRSIEDHFNKPYVLEYSLQRKEP